MIAQEVATKYFGNEADFILELCKSGSINETYKVTLKKGDTKEDFVLQKMNVIFDPALVEDVFFITEYLTSKNIKTKRVIKTLEGDIYLTDGASWWRMTTYLSGVSFLELSKKEQSKSAGEMVGRFHNALADCDYEFKFKLPHYHTDTPFYMGRLKEVLSEYKDIEKYILLKDTGEEILSLYEKLPKISNLPIRIVHGDLKISNVLFDASSREAISLLDLDTLMRGDIAIELGDALRSWCMKGGEDTDIVIFDREIYDSALDGYYATAKFLTEKEKQMIPLGVKTITLELSARFLTDAFEEKHFKTNSPKYKNLFEQNKTRAENQLAFFKEFSKLF